MAYLRSTSKYRPQHYAQFLCIFAYGLCLHSLSLAVEGIDPVTGGHWRNPSVLKPWSVDDSNRYGNDGYHFFNVTAPGGNGKSYQAVDKNLKSKLPHYLKAITPAPGTHTAASYHYLLINDPDDSSPAMVESGVLAMPSYNSKKKTDMLRLEFGQLPQPHGIRIGILICNGDKSSISPQAIQLSSEDKSWSRTIQDIPHTIEGLWVFFKIPAQYSEKSLTLSIFPRSNAPASLGGLVFDSFTQKPPHTPIHVVADTPIGQNSHISWIADLPQSQQPTMQHNSWEHQTALRLLTSYRHKHERLQAIDNHLNRLALPYQGEPTGSAGYLSTWRYSDLAKVTLTFQWPKHVDIDAIALLPLRLFLGSKKGLTENAYWPKKITITAMQEEKPVVLATLHHSETSIQQSLPQFIHFDTTRTKTIHITLTQLTKQIGSNQYAAGFSEICIFSQKDNVAPRATISTKSNRKGSLLFSKDYLHDNQTPLGLPEIGPRDSIGLGISIRPQTRLTKNPIAIELDFDQPIIIDAVRLDPAIIDEPGQGFPIRFSVELLDSHNNTLQGDFTYHKTPFAPIGLNPYISYFSPTKTHRIRIHIYESSQPIANAKPWIQISEITPLRQGVPLSPNAEIRSKPRHKPRYVSKQSVLANPSGMALTWSLQSAYNQRTQTGKILSHYDWLQQLSQRRHLLEEQKTIEAEQAHTRKKVRISALWTFSSTLLFSIAGSLYVVIRNRQKARQEMQSTREGIASDLHDDVGSNLSTITLHSEYLLEHTTEPSLQKRLRSITKLAEESTFGLREVLHTTAPSIGRIQNLSQFIQKLTESLLLDIHYQIHIDPQVHQQIQSPQLRKGLLLYYKEALTNIRNHAQSTQVQIQWIIDTHTLEVKISDNGVGISQEKIAHPNTLRTLKIRAKDLNGQLAIDSQENKGTTLTLVISIHP